MTKPKMSVNAIVAVSESMGIGLENQLPWHLPSDMKFFQKTTTQFNKDSDKQNAVIMGRKTWQSIPAKFRPLKKRLNVVLSRDEQFLSLLPQDVLGFVSLEAALAALQDNSSISNIFIIGGATVYDQALSSQAVDRLFITRVRRLDSELIPCDTFFPTIPAEFQRVSTDLGAVEENDFQLEFEVYERV